MGIDFQNDAAFAGFGDGVTGIGVIAETEQQIWLRFHWNQIVLKVVRFTRG